MSQTRKNMINYDYVQSNHRTTKNLHISVCWFKITFKLLLKLSKFILCYVVGKRKSTTKFSVGWSVFGKKEIFHSWENFINGLTFQTVLFYVYKMFAI